MEDERMEGAVDATKPRLQPFSTSAHGRQAVLRHLTCLRNPTCALRYLDNLEIAVDEIIAAHFHGASPAAVDDFRFAVTCHRLLDGKGAAEVTALHVPSCQLGTINPHVLKRYPKLRELDVSNNNLDDSALLQAGLEALRLTHLDVSYNQVCGENQSLPCTVRVVTWVASASVPVTRSRV